MINFPDTAAIGEIFTPPGGGSPSFVYRGSDVWQNVGMGFGYQPQLFTATPGQTVFTVAYQVGAVEVFMEGAQLHPTEFTATNGTSITLADPCLGGEKIVILPHSVISTLQGLNKNLNLSDLLSVDTALTNLGFSALGKTLRAIADEAAVRNAIAAPARPQSAAGVGEVVTINPPGGAAAVLPAGGMWLWFVFSYATAGTNIAQGGGAGVGAGGSTIRAATAGQAHTGFAWRIA